jgi:hypothetical protein
VESNDILNYIGETSTLSDPAQLSTFVSALHPILMDSLAELYAYQHQADPKLPRFVNKPAGFSLWATMASWSSPTLAQTKSKAETDILSERLIHAISSLLLRMWLAHHSAVSADSLTSGLSPEEVAVVSNSVNLLPAIYRSWSSLLSTSGGQPSLFQPVHVALQRLDELGQQRQMSSDLISSFKDDFNDWIRRGYAANALNSALSLDDQLATESAIRALLQFRNIAPKIKATNLAYPNNAVLPPVQQQERRFDLAACLKSLAAAVGQKNVKKAAQVLAGIPAEHSKEVAKRLRSAVDEVGSSWLSASALSIVDVSQDNQIRFNNQMVKAIQHLVDEKAFDARRIVHLLSRAEGSPAESSIAPELGF